MGVFRRRSSPEPIPAADADTSSVQGPSWMSAEDWSSRLVAYRRQGRSDVDIRDIARHLEERGPRQPRQPGMHRPGLDQSIVTRADYVPSEREDEHLTRDENGLPRLRLVDAGDRLAIWSPLDGGALLNPKGTGLRQFGLVATYVRGSTHHASAFRSADLRQGRPVELRREPDNPYDKNAVALYAAGGRAPFGYVQKGRAAAIARRMDAGEHMAGVSLRGPGPRRDDDSAFLLLGSVADLAALLSHGV